jgi:ADP-heptose:LPS heptosyltransferase
MHLLTTTTEIDLGPFGLYPPGKYVVEDLNGATIMMASLRGKVKMAPIPDGVFLPFDESLDWNGKSVLIVRPGGFGDILFTTPAIAEMKRRWPQIRIDLCAFGRFQPIVAYSDYDNLVAYPLPLEQAQSYDCVIALENTIEGNPEAEAVHAVDLMARKLGLSHLSDKKMRYVATPDEIEWAAARYPRTEKVRIGIQVEASMRLRSYPGNLLIEVLAGLVKKEYEVFLFGEPYKLKLPEFPLIRNLTSEGLQFRQSVAVMATCDAFLGPDSVLVHVAGVLNVPTVALYGPFPYALRTTYSPSIFAIQGHKGCDLAPCFYHGGPQAPHFPFNGPCAKTGRCEVLASIPPAQIISRLQSVMKRKEALTP